MNKSIKLSMLEENYESIMDKLNRTNRNKQVSHFKPITLGCAAGFEIYITNKEVKQKEEDPLLEIKRFYPMPRSKSTNVIAKYLRLCEYSLGFEMVMCFVEVNQEDLQESLGGTETMGHYLEGKTTRFLYTANEE